MALHAGSSQLSNFTSSGDCGQDIRDPHHCKLGRLITHVWQCWYMDIPDIFSTTHPDDDADATATAEPTDNFNCTDTMDADDITHMVDLTEAKIYQQIMMAYPKDGHSAEVWSSALPGSVESHMPLLTPPIQCNGGNFYLQPLLVLTVNHFPLGSAGALVPGAHQGSSLYQMSQEALGPSIWAPFQSQCDWEVAHWAMLQHQPHSWIYWLYLVYIPHSSILHNSVANLLWKVISSLELSYWSVKELNAIIDKKLLGCPSIMCWDLVIGGETLHFYHRDIIQCIQSLYGNP